MFRHGYDSEDDDFIDREDDMAEMVCFEDQKIKEAKQYEQYKQRLKKQQEEYDQSLKRQQMELKRLNLVAEYDPNIDKRDSRGRHICRHLENWKTNWDSTPLDIFCLRPHVMWIRQSEDVHHPLVLDEIKNHLVSNVANIVWSYTGGDQFYHPNIKERGKSQRDELHEMSKDVTAFANAINEVYVYRSHCPKNQIDSILVGKTLGGLYFSLYMQCTIQVRNTMLILAYEFENLYQCIYHDLH